jgi:hypothetical protein
MEERGPASVVPLTRTERGGSQRYGSCSTSHLGCAPGVFEIQINRDEDDIMLFTIAVVLLVLWVMGFVAFHVTTGFVHLLLLAAVVAVVVQLVAGRRAI